jgi:hypothetical protein
MGSSEGQAKMVEMLVKKNPDLFQENRPVEVEFFSRDETGKGRAQARTVLQCFNLCTYINPNPCLAASGHTKTEFFFFL